jgi:hypothetical protein
VELDYNSHKDEFVGLTHRLLEQNISNHEKTFIGISYVTNDIFGPCATIQEECDALKISDEQFATGVRVSTSTTNNLAAVRKGKHLETRRYNSLHNAWDVPHHAHGPEQAGYRDLSRIWKRPTPDWDVVGVDKPVFAQRKKDEKMSLLGTFNAQEDAKECVRQMYKEREKYVTPVTTRQVDFPPRRPIYEGAAPPKLELASKKPTVQEEKSRWEKGT